MGERILIWGAGAIGGSVGAFLWRAGHDVAFVDSSADHVSAINRGGLRIVGSVAEFTALTPAYLPDQVDGSWPIVALAVKAQYTETACLQLTKHLTKDGFVVSLQNGLCEVVLQQVLGQDRVMGALVGFAGDQLEPGVLRFSQRAKFCIGELDGTISGRATALGRLMADFEPDIEVTDDIWGYLWGKLAFISLLYGSALGTSTLTSLFGAETYLPVWRQLAGEIVEVAIAEGQTPRGFDGLVPAAFLHGTKECAARDSMQAISKSLIDSPKTHSGMWRDIAIHHRRTEIDVQIGPVLEIAARHGIAVPALTRLIELIHLVESGLLTQSDPLILQLISSGSKKDLPHQSAEGALS